MASTNFLTSLGYNNQKRIINWKIKTNSNIQFNKYSNMIRSIKRHFYHQSAQKIHCYFI